MNSVIASTLYSPAGRHGQIAMFRSILCVCTGNLCRSPMAAALLQARLGPAIAVTSAGTAAPEGEPAVPHAVAVMAAAGIDLTPHRAELVTPMHLQAAEVVLTADSGHVRTLLRLAPAMRGRVFRLGHWRDIDIPDPIGYEEMVFRRCRDLIDECTTDWMSHLQTAAREKRR